jgi:hypothetical protein
MYQESAPFVLSGRPRRANGWLPANLSDITSFTVRVLGLHSRPSTLLPHFTIEVTCREAAPDNWLDAKPRPFMDGLQTRGLTSTPTAQKPHLTS